MGESEKRFAFLGVGDAVEGEQIGDIPFFEWGSADFETADLAAGGADGVSSGLTSDSAGLAQPA